jgi:hypothetical protein
MEECIMEAMPTIRKMVSVFTSGWMGVLTLETGSSESKTVREFTFFQMAQLERDFTMETTARSGFQSLKLSKLNTKLN